MASPPAFLVAVAEPLGEVVGAWLVRTSWQALVLVAIVAAVQLALGKWLVPRWRYALWMLVVARLLMPALPQSPWSVFNVPVPRASNTATVADAVLPRPTEGVTVMVVKTFDVDATVAPVEAVDVAPTPAAFDWRRALLAVWIAGAVLLVLRIVVAHVLLTRRLRGAPQVSGDVLALLDDCRRAMGVRANVQIVPTDAVGGPALFGFLRPRLLIPPAMLATLAHADLRFVFLHELAHLRRRDTWLNLPLSLAAALHWFNPAVWFALSRCRTERELACDAMVLEATDAPGAQHGYGQTMLRVAESLCAPRPRVAVPAALGILETRSQLNRRITMISAFRRGSVSRRWSVLPALLLVGVASCALTDKPSNDRPATQPVAAASASAASPVAGALVAVEDSKGGAPVTAAEVLLKAIGERPQEDKAADATAVDAETARVNQLMDRRFAELKYDAIPFAEVVEQLREKTGMNILVNWRQLEAEGIDRAAPVTTRLRDVKFSKALRTILDDVGGGTVHLGYTVDEGVLTITTADDLARNTITRVYDIRDLITEVPDYAPPGEAKAQPQPQPTTQPRPEPSLIEQVTELIRETVEPDAWRDAGGTVGSIRELSGQLIITATPQMHDGIAKLLHMVREARGVQIAVEARFIAIDPAALDAALGERLKNTLGKSGAATVWQLSDDEVQAVLRAAQGSQQTTLVTAPRITLFNGQRAFVNVGTQHAYVSGFTVIKKDGGETRYEPKISVADSGILLDLRATASADRQRAVLTLKPRISRLEGLRPEPYMGSKELYVQVPLLVVHELQTTLSIPDRGTALIGGFVQTPNAGAANAGELVGQPGPVESEVAVPDGGKLMIGGKPSTMPALSRLILNKMPPSQNVFLLVKPTLVITQPQAQKEFPILSVPKR